MLYAIVKIIYILFVLVLFSEVMINVNVSIFLLIIFVLLKSVSG
jgi:hypothetical protein